MERDQIFEKEPSYPSTTTPHFDEEWTVLAARPVVPLNEVKSHTRRRTAWNLAGAFAVAVVLGAFVALLSASLSDSTRAVTADSSAAPERIAATEQTLSEQTAIAEPSLVPSDPMVESETQNVESAPTLAPKTPTTLAVKAKNSQKTSEKSIPANTIDSRADDPVEDTLEAVPPQRVIDRFEERRMRRVFRQQQRRERAANRQRDLLRIDELFEGRRP